MQSDDAVGEDVLKYRELQNEDEPLEDMNKNEANETKKQPASFKTGARARDSRNFVNSNVGQ